MYYMWINMDIANNWIYETFFRSHGCFYKQVLLYIEEIQVFVLDFLWSILVFRNYRLENNFSYTREGDFSMFIHLVNRFRKYEHNLALIDIFCQSVCFCFLYAVVSKAATKMLFFSFAFIIEIGKTVLYVFAHCWGKLNLSSKLFFNMLVLMKCTNLNTIHVLNTYQSFVYF